MTERTPSVRVLLVASLGPPVVAGIGVLTAWLLTGSRPAGPASGGPEISHASTRAVNPGRHEMPLKTSNEPTKSNQPSSAVNPGRHDMALRTYLATAPREPTTFTLFCMISDYYNYDFRGGQDTLYSVDMEEPKTRVRIHGYVPKDSALGNRVFETLKDGKYHRCTVEVQHIGHNSSHVALTGFEPWGPASPSSGHS
jgi:hypothetical protein